jgi:type I restriction enzyme, S subunit
MKTSQQTLPKGWAKKQIKDLLDYERPDNYIVKSTSYSNSAKTPVLTANKSFVLGYTDEDFGICKDTPTIIFDDFTTDSKYVDFPFKIKSSAIKLLRSKNHETDLKFVYEKMKSINFPTGSHKRYYISQYQDMEVAVPPFPEQKRIAEILEGVNEQIKKTDEIIVATEELKEGLMRQLFIHGIGHKKFTDTEIGKIPLEWDIKPLGRLRKTVTSGSRGWAQYYADSGAMFIRIGNLSRKNINLKLDEVMYVQPPEGGEGVRTKTKTGDVLISITADLGLIALIPESLGNAYVNQHIALVRFDDPELLAPWVANYLRTATAQKQFSSYNDAGAKAGLNLPTIDRVLIPVPKNPIEQKRIIQVISTVESKIQINKKLKEKYLQLKKGLVQDLLSGQKRTV